MLTPEERHHAEQNITYLGETLPALWRAIYEGCRERHFTAEESLILLRTYITSQGTGDKKASDQ